MKKRLAVVLYPGVADWELSLPIFCLHPRIAHTFISIGPERVKTAHGFEIGLSHHVRGLKASEFDGIYLPGGIDPDQGRFPRSLCEDSGLIGALREFADQAKPVAAICGAPLVLGSAGLLRGRRFVCDITEDTRGYLDGAIRVDGPMTVDGNILTGSVRAIIPFTVELARLLGDETTAREISEFFGA